MAGAKILLIEDSKGQARLTTEALEQAGYDVCWVADATAGIKSATTNPPDIILLDINLPDISGVQLCWWFKQNSRTEAIPIIMLTAKSSVEDKIFGIEVGADDYLPKPYDSGELKAKIYAALRTKGLQDKLRLQNRELSELLEKVESLAVTDPLTGLFNRRRLEEALDMEWKRAVRYGQDLSVLMMDIDHFKSVNDVFGHKAGDTVIQDFALILKHSLREIDTVARWGGEEFLAVLPNTEPKQGAIAAAHILERVSGHKFSDLAGRQVTISIGLAALSSGIDSPGGLVEAADGALYKAKGNGRNRIEVALQAQVRPAGN